MKVNGLSGEMVMAKLKENWFFLVLVLIFVLTVFELPKAFSIVGAFLKSNHGPDIVIIMIFLFSGVTLDSAKLFSGMKEYKSILIALGVIFIAAPLIAALFSFLPIGVDVITGVFLVSAMPTTLSSGVVMTGKAGGNIVNALMITIIASLVAVLTIPVTLELLLPVIGTGSEVDIDKGRIIIRLGLFVLLPLVVGVIARLIATPFFQTYGKGFSLSNQWLVLGMVWMAASQAKEVILANSGALPLIAVVVFGFHFLLTGFAYLMTILFRLPPGKRESVIFMGGQKTLPLAVMLQIALFPQYPVVLVVCVLHHAIHLMMDSYLAGRMERANGE